MASSPIMFLKSYKPTSNNIRLKMQEAYRMDEEARVLELIDIINLNPNVSIKISELATKLIQQVRAQQTKKSGMEAFMMHYDLSTEEGIMLMCIAESLLRIPDTVTENLLIRDKLSSANWDEHIGKSESTFVNLITRGLVLSSKILKPEEAGSFKNAWKNMVHRLGEPVIRQAVREAIKVMSEQFVIGRTMKEALKRSEEYRKKGYTFSYDMLGEAAKTHRDAERYFEAYKKSIEELGRSHDGVFSFQGPSISVKLSALYPRYEFAKMELAVPYLTEKLTELALLAKMAGLSLTVDAEEADRLEMSLDIFANVFKIGEFKDWSGLGLAVQAYQKRAYYVLEWLIELARLQNKKIPIRLVKGAYWDTEIKVSQMAGFSNYPVFTRKVSTDISYLACAKLMINAPEAVYPQFATHNAYSVAAILTMMGNYRDYEFEFQNLQGMGKALHNEIVDKSSFGIPSRIYAPVGSHEDLLPYLVRRLLENGANSSFVNQIADSHIPIEKLIENPVQKLREYASIPNTKIALPPDLYGFSRRNSSGVDVSNISELSVLSSDVNESIIGSWVAYPFNNSKVENKITLPITNPADRREIVGECFLADEADVEKALENAHKIYPAWNAKPLAERAAILQKVADLLEAHRGQLVAMAIHEAGKVLSDALSEVREAVDFCRYYALSAIETLSPKILPGPTGELNELRLNGRGIMVCISPWNFPIAIFTGQIAAALVSGNAVVAKPAEQTPLVAAFVIDLFYEAGVPHEALQLLPGRGEVVGAKLVSDPRVDGVLFTGSTETARLINQNLAARKSSIATLIAETGGMNALIADSTALPEQVVSDVLSSAFGSAGQRCSALRILFLQEEIADKVIHMLEGAMAEIIVGNPQFLETDIGPVIDEEAKSVLNAHIEKMTKEATLIYRVELPPITEHGTFVGPHAFELPNIKLLEREVFGPVLHIIRYKKENLTQVIEDINSLNFGLTFGIHSRINETIDYIVERIQAGNIYINRNMIGAVVGVQPFGGHRLSGTGPKAGGPHYLLRLCTETTITTNTVAMGGNAGLMSLED